MSRSFLKPAGLSLILCLFIHTFARAQDTFEEIESLRNGARLHLIDHLKQASGSANQDIEVKMLPLDPRLRLSRCDAPIDFQVTSAAASFSSATVKISCNGYVHWSLYAPAQIAVFGETAVASRSLERGSLIQPGDFHFVRQNLTLIGANFVDPTAVILGQELKRSMRAGEPLRLSYLELPKIVQRGDRVTLEAQALGLNVAAPGLAMANGKVGERIQVKNAQSNRIVDALVIAPGRVRVKYE